MGKEGSGNSEEACKEENTREEERKKIFIVGGGTSVTPILNDPLLKERLEAHDIIGCNKAVEHVNCKYLAIFDHENFINGKYSHSLDTFNGKGGIYAPTTKKTDYIQDGITYVKRNVRASYSFKDGIYVGNNCGTFALSLAIALGYKDIYLLGMDARYNVEQTKSHFHDGYKREVSGGLGESIYAKFATFFEYSGKHIKENLTGVNVYNCSYISLIDIEEKYFKRIDIREVI
jgi:hypothetical protein